MEGEAIVAYTPPYIDVTMPDGSTVRVPVRVVRPFRQLVPVEFCWLYRAGIEHSCDEMRCWPEDPV